MVFRPVNDFSSMLVHRWNSRSIGLRHVLQGCDLPSVQGSDDDEECSETLNGPFSKITKKDPLHRRREFLQETNGPPDGPFPNRKGSFPPLLIRPHPFSSPLPYRSTGIDGSLSLLRFERVSSSTSDRACGDTRKKDFGSRKRKWREEFLECTEERLILVATKDTVRDLLHKVNVTIGGILKYSSIISNLKIEHFLYSFTYES